MSIAPSPLPPDAHPYSFLCFTVSLVTRRGCAIQARNQLSLPEFFFQHRENLSLITLPARQFVKLRCAWILYGSYALRAAMSCSRRR
jgi:hypothetical protein